MGSKEAPSQNEAQAKRIAELEQILEGVPEGAFEGGWTAKGIMKHAADLERENKTLRQLKTLERMNDAICQLRGVIKVSGNIAVFFGVSKTYYGYLRHDVVTGNCVATQFDIRDKKE